MEIYISVSMLCSINDKNLSNLSLILHIPTYILNQGSICYLVKMYHICFVYIYPLNDDQDM